MTDMISVARKIADRLPALEPEARAEAVAALRALGVPGKLMHQLTAALTSGDLPRARTLWDILRPLLDVV